MKYTWCTVVLASLLLLLAGCGGGSSKSPVVSPPAADLTGSWEAVAQSTALPGYTTTLEMNFSQNGGMLSASGIHNFDMFQIDPNGNFLLGGACGATSSIAGNVDSAGNVNVSFSEGTAIFTATGVLTSDKKTINGTFQGTTSGCVDSGKFIAYRADPFAGSWTWYGGSCPDGFFTTTCTLDQSSALDVAISESSDHTVTVSGSGATTAAFTLSGFVVGNGGSVQGTINGTDVTYYASQDWTWTFNSAPTVKYPCIIVTDTNLTIVGIMLPAGTPFSGTDRKGSAHPRNGGFVL